MDKKARNFMIDALVASDQKGNSLSVPGAFVPPLPERNALFGSLDMNRPKLENPDGSISTERTITIDAQMPDGRVRWFNIPTIVGGVELSEDQATNLFFSGGNKPVGEFDTLERALEAARSRSNAIGLIRGPK